jgi:hypothetical protein
VLLPLPPLPLLPEPPEPVPAPLLPLLPPEPVLELPMLLLPEPLLVRAWQSCLACPLSLSQGSDDAPLLLPLLLCAPAFWATDSPRAAALSAAAIRVSFMIAPCAD